ncbi:hypothetical protein [Nostoc sp.]|uniref:hypothetical protein n=1 Tax=Nostoc sp. TaxID=1180 RepID=UPI002FF5B9AF
MKISEYPSITSVSAGDLLLVETANDNAYKNIPISQLGGGSRNSQIFPNSFSHWHDESVILTGNGLMTDIYSNYAYSTLAYQNPPAINDSFQFNKLLDAGNYTFYLLGAQGSNRGTIRLNVNGTEVVGDLDFYGNNFTGITLHTTINIATPGIQTFKITTIGKNASSSGFYIILTKLWGIKQ